MRIVGIECFGLEALVAMPFQFSQGSVTKRQTVLVRVETDSGLEGWGEIFCQATPIVYTTLIAELLAPKLINADPWDREVLWQRLYNSTIVYGQRGLVVGALSGLDIALWDVVGRDCVQPVNKLMGGSARTELQAYATGLYRQPGQDWIEALADEARSHVEQGFRTLKMKVGFGIRQDFTAVEAVRSAIGNDVAIAVDANHAYLPHQAIELGRLLAPLDIAWFEEPVSPDDCRGYAEVRANQPIPVAGGELTYTRFGFRELLDRRSVDILQPDLGLCGGLSEARAIGDLARAQNIACWAHVWGTGVAQAASLHFLSHLPTTTASEDLAAPLMEWDCTENPLRDSIVRYSPKVCNGRVKVPTGAGLGVSVDRNELMQFLTAHSSTGLVSMPTQDAAPVGSNALTKASPVESRYAEDRASTRNDDVPQRDCGCKPQDL